MAWHPDMPESYKNKIVTGDARELAKAIPDESMDLIFTDPVYDRIDDYKWLARTAIRVLKPDSTALVWCGKRLAAHCQIAMEEVGLEYVYTLDYVVPAKPYRLMYYHLFLWTTPCLWMQKGRSIPNRWLPDTIISRQSTKGSHVWNKNPEAMSSWLEAFSTIDSVVFDPFTGSGTIPSVCKILERNYVAFEIDPKTAENARQRVANTQVPMFQVQPTEMKMFD